ncbi:MAG: hypothetical protein R3C49_13185 [Planctomycetaceae bacterium]
MTTSSAHSVHFSRIALILSAVWASGFLWYFFQQNLPNLSPGQGDQAITRLDVAEAIFVDAPSLLNPLNYSGSGQQQAGWKYLPQRVPYICTSAALLLAALGLGAMVCRLLLNDFPLTYPERFVLIGAVGLSLQSLWVLICGLAGWLTPLAVLTPGVLMLLVGFRWLLTGTGQRELLLPDRSAPSGPVRCLLWLPVAPFVLHILLGGMTPPFDFDVREYHLQGPREWFEAGHIFFLEHNVYTSFPFLSEMLSLGTMVLIGDSWGGAIAGKLVLTAFPLLSAMCVFSIARRAFGWVAGYMAAAAFLSTPWITRISIIAYAEGAITLYLIVSAMSALLAAGCRDDRIRLRLFGLCGFLAGSAMASKYPGLVSVVLPTGLFLLFITLKHRLGAGQGSSSNDIPSAHRVLRYASVYIAGIVIAVGPWLLRNTVWTGNPVYPLGYSVFGGRGWDSDMDGKWKRAHSASEHSLQMIPEHLLDVTVRNDWQNGFLFAFAVPAVLVLLGNSTTLRLGLFAIWILLTWWLLTHRIDRFWVPLIPVLAVLAGSAWTISSSAFWRLIMIAALCLTCVFNYGFDRLGVVGFHAGLLELSTARRLPIRQDIQQLNESLQGARVLMVGEAEVFDAQFPVLYNTVFDKSLFQLWTSANPDQDVPDHDQQLRSPSEIISALRDHDVEYVYVNWSEILRYRLTYGYTEYVEPVRFQDLVSMKVLEAPQTLAVGSWNGLSEQQQSQVLSWRGGDSLVAGDQWTTILLYRVSKPASH